eukprot:CAMPEP_0170167478 /NCGR_PEP_ID=MMETSP0040_2-20121228/876_1 /TAXON_ID=641309 /ORGANISM="Lotharella oceanica, Strain CCMP622" /LENGTH=284 /DNA_ID=CAMNT_0010405523 /DNA_START=848 /DNA_END=1704 /DNA_ORIENTATION=+
MWSMAGTRQQQVGPMMEGVVAAAAAAPVAVVHLVAVAAVFAAVDAAVVGAAAGVVRVSDPSHALVGVSSGLSAAESLVACGADERFFPRMRTDMCVEVSALPERLRTEHAHVGFLTADEVQELALAREALSSLASLPDDLESFCSRSLDGRSLLFWACFDASSCSLFEGMPPDSRDSPELAEKDSSIPEFPRLTFTDEGLSSDEYMVFGELDPFVGGFANVGFRSLSDLSLSLRLLKITLGRTPSFKTLVSSSILFAMRLSSCRDALVESAVLAAGSRGLPASR